MFTAGHATTWEVADVRNAKERLSEMWTDVYANETAEWAVNDRMDRDGVMKVPKRQKILCEACTHAQNLLKT
jgi:hypothetical protein